MEANFGTISILVVLGISVVFNVVMLLIILGEGKPVKMGEGFDELMKKIEEDEARRGLPPFVWPNGMEWPAGYYGGRVQMFKKEINKVAGKQSMSDYDNCPQYNGGYVKPGMWGMCETCGGAINAHEGAKEAAYEERLRDFKSMGIDDFIKKHGGEG